MTSALRSGLTGQSITTNSLVESALEQPLGIGATFFVQAKGSLIESFGFGTAYRSRVIPDGAPTEPGMFEADDDFERRRAEASPWSEQDYKGSAFFREGISYDESMNEERAAVLASFYDAKQVRSFYASKRPFTSFLGNIAGSIPDPINYVPFVGQLAKAKAVSKFGRVAGTAASSSVDAAVNTAVFGALTAPTRRKFGDDVSLGEIGSQVAIAAVIGAGFGATAGAIGKRVDARLKERLATIKNQNKAIAALNDAVGGVVETGEVKLNQNSVRFAGNILDNIKVMEPAVDIKTPADFGRLRASQIMPEEISRLDDLEKTYSANKTELDKLLAETTNNEEFRETRAKLTEVAQLETKFDDLTAKAEAANSEKQKAQLQKRADAVGDQIGAILKTVDEQKAERIEFLDQAIPLRRKVLKKVEAERNPLSEKVDEVVSREADAFLKQNVAERPRKFVINKSLGRPAEVNTSVPPTPPPPEALKKAAASIGKGENPQAVAEQFGVNAESGDFVELQDIELLKSEGALTPDDIAELDDAAKDYEIGKKYAETINYAVGCMI